MVFPMIRALISAPVIWRSDANAWLGMLSINIDKGRKYFIDIIFATPVIFSSSNSCGGAVSTALRLRHDEYYNFNGEASRRLPFPAPQEAFLIIVDGKFTSRPCESYRLTGLCPVVLRRRHSSGRLQVA